MTTKLSYGNDNNDHHYINEEGYIGGYNNYNGITAPAACEDTVLIMKVMILRMVMIMNITKIFMMTMKL